MKIFTRKQALGYTVAGGFALATPWLHASGPALSGLVAVADSAESAFTAPAAMARLSGTHKTVQGIVVESFSSFDVDESKTTIDGGDPDNGSSPIIIPSAYYVRQLNDKWNAGISLTVPSGFGSDYGNTWAGRYQTVDFSLVYVALTSAVSYRINDKLSLGAAVGINYTAENSEVKIPQPLGDTDGKLSSDLDGVGVNLGLSVFYEFDEQTRAGFAWTGETEADLEGNVRLRKLGPVFDDLITEAGLKNINTEVTNTFPQRALAGVYHEFDSGNFVTLDAAWIEFSKFSTTDLKLDGINVNVSAPKIYDDIWAVTAGLGFPVDSRTTYRVGAAYVSQGVDDEDRKFSIRIDAMWAVGVGVSYKFSDERSVDVNASLVNVGKSSVDISSDRLGRVAGENDDPYALALEVAYHF